MISDYSNIVSGKIFWFETFVWLMFLCIYNFLNLWSFLTWQKSYHMFGSKINEETFLEFVKMNQIPWSSLKTDTRSEKNSNKICLFLFTSISTWESIKYVRPTKKVITNTRQCSNCDSDDSIWANLNVWKNSQAKYTKWPKKNKSTKRLTENN